MNYMDKQTAVGGIQPLSETAAADRLRMQKPQRVDWKVASFGAIIVVVITTQCLRIS